MGNAQLCVLWNLANLCPCFPEALTVVRLMIETFLDSWGITSVILASCPYSADIL